MTWVPLDGADGGGERGGGPCGRPHQQEKLAVGAPAREPADRCRRETVTLAFHNSGGTAVRSGTVTFGTRIIGAGARKVRTWTVCVEAWRVPPGMHIETRDVSVRWE
ncbi:hypothetical protein ACFYNL_16270 [Streptomyces sp. NPDC007808]|uniref:hypothetical protein n=1 Tax=Streptomyces sp. NPDC007808 TaxID=3364779 RepID=UPI0036C7DE46